MCGCYVAYANIPRLCHACNVTPEESEDPSHVCNYLYMQEINQKCNEAMKVFSPNNYDNNEDILAMTKEQLKQKLQQNNRNFKPYHNTFIVMLLKMFGWVPIHMVCWNHFLMT